MVSIQLMGIHWLGFSQQHSLATIIGGSSLIKVAQGEDNIIKVNVELALTKRVILTMLRGQIIALALVGASMVLSTSQGHSWVCPGDSSVQPGEASTQTLKAEAHSGPGIWVRERANRDMREPDLQGHVWVDLLKRILSSQAGMRNLYLVVGVIREVGVELPA